MYAARSALLLFLIGAATLQAAPLKRRSLLRRHVVVDFGHRPSPLEIDALNSSGARIVQVRSDSSFVVNVPDRLEVAHLQEDRHKISPLWNDVGALSGGAFALVEFYPDVDMNDARAIVINDQLQVIDNPDLVPKHLLVAGSPAAIAGLAQRDEVAYIFPASDDLIQGVAVNGCAGALTDQGPIGQSVAKIGDGWDGPGLGGADLFYSFVHVSEKVAADAAQSEITRAFAEWARYAKLTFTPTNDPLGRQTIAVLFASRDHGDSYPFDGPGGALAHTFYPTPVNPEPIAGDMHFDADENWQIGSGVDVFSVALHESGHALGLGHSDKPGSVMYPYYRKVTALAQEDIDAILTLYAPQAATPSAPPPPPLALTINDPGPTTTVSTLSLTGAVTGGAGSPKVTWSSDHGVSGAATGSNAWTIPAIPLGAGPNGITVTAADSSGQVTRTIFITRVQPAPPASAPVLQILAPASAPTYVAVSANLNISGTASDSSGISRVSWTSSHGGYGVASGTTNWSIGPVTLEAGTTVFTVAAQSQSSGTATRTLDVTYTPPPGPTPAPTPPPAPTPSDTTAPALTIISPASTSVSTNAASIAINGTAKDNVGVAGVAWTTSNGDSGNAAGTENWNITAVPLLAGANTITIKARDAAGNVAWRSLVVTRR